MLNRYIYIILIFAITLPISAQNGSNLHENLFSSALASNFKKYEAQSSKAYRNKDFKRGDFLLDSLITNCLKTTKFDNFRANKLNGKTISVNSYFTKPTLLITYASWCLISEGQTQAINDLAKEHSENIDFVILFWDTKQKAKKASKKYSRHISVLYIDELENTFSNEIKFLKHSFGFPTSFYLDQNNRVVDIKRPKSISYSNDFEIKSYTKSYIAFEAGVNNLLPNSSLKDNLAIN